MLWAESSGQEVREAHCVEGTKQAQYGWNLEGGCVRGGAEKGKSDEMVSKVGVHCA